VRALILALRDRGCTVFFSSHVLSDAEALCNRVAILAKGRLVATGSLADMQAFRASGWELVVAGVDDTAIAAVGARARSAVRIGDGRFMLELPLDPGPERVLTDLTKAGAQLVSLNPIRQTLEDFFVAQVSSAEAMSAPRGLEEPAAEARR
jgi:ABC-2 type transport system ATP-binding protein